jgi:AhpC/TSA antioxidant enzyme
MTSLAEISYLRRLSERLDQVEARGAGALGVSVGADHQTLADEGNGVRFPLLVDPDRRVYTALELPRRWWVGLNPRGWWNYGRALARGIARAGSSSRTSCPGWRCSTRTRGPSGCTAARRSATTRASIACWPGSRRSRLSRRRARASCSRSSCRGIALGASVLTCPIIAVVAIGIRSLNARTRLKRVRACPAGGSTRVRGTARSGCRLRSGVEPEGMLEVGPGPGGSCLES